MGIKLEFLLAVLIVTMLSLAYTVKLSDDTAMKKPSKKEMEFTDTTFTEVDTQKLISTSFGKYGMREGGILIVNDLVYHTDSIELLLANRGRYIGEKVYLEGNVRMKQKEGYNYRAENAVYDKKMQIFTITSKFTAMMDKNIVQGNTAQYDTRKKILVAKEVEAVVYTAEN
jgi:lipopolysaccharide assembly outer membrane protein LptD (OstA)